MNKAYGIGAALLGSILLAALPARAQNFWIGPEAGIDFAKTSYSDDVHRIQISNSYQSGFTGGLAAESGFTDSLSIRVEALYVRRETKAFTPSLEGLPPISGKYRLDSIDFPATLHFNFGEKAVQPYLFAGVDVSTLIKAENTNTSAGATQTFDVKNEFDRTNFGLVGGGGAFFHLGHAMAITVDARYVYGLTNIARHTGFSWKTRDIQVLGGFLFGF